MVDAGLSFDVPKLIAVSTPLGHFGVPPTT
jgi:hypothetical protein